MRAHRNDRLAPRERGELGDVLRRAYSLSSADQLKLYETFREYLGQASGQESERDREVRNRIEALDVMAKVNQHLALARGAAPTVAQFNQAARGLGLDWNSARMIRAWGSWSNAKTAFGGGRVSEASAQRAVRRKSSGRKRSREEYLAGVRRWLATGPPSTSTLDYDQFAQDSQAEPGLPLVRYTSLHNALGLGWPDILAVARGEREHQEMRQQSEQAIRAGAGPLELIGHREIALLLGINMACVHTRRGRGELPPPVARLRSHPVYHLDDVLAYRDQKPWPERQEHSWQERLIDSVQLAKRLGIEELSLKAFLWKRSWHLVPKPAGSAARSAYWMPDDLERWLAENPRRETGPPPAT